MIRLLNVKIMIIVSLLRRNILGPQENGVAVHGKRGSGKDVIVARMNLQGNIDKGGHNDIIY